MLGIETGNYRFQTDRTEPHDPVTKVVSVDYLRVKREWAMRGSNPRPPACKNSRMDRLFWF